MREEGEKGRRNEGGGMEVEYEMKKRPNAKEAIKELFVNRRASMAESR